MIERTWEDIDLSNPHEMNAHRELETDKVYWRTVFDQLEKRRKRAPTKRQIRLYNLVNGADVDPNNTFTGIDDKRYFIIGAGYRTLNGHQGEQVTVNSAKKSRIGQMVRDTCLRVSSYLKTQNQ